MWGEEEDRGIETSGGSACWFAFCIKTDQKPITVSCTEKLKPVF